MPSNFDWIFKRDPYAAERERASGYVTPPRGFGRFGLPRLFAREEVAFAPMTADRGLDSERLRSQEGQPTAATGK
jgi:hypothetical protein